MNTSTYITMTDAHTFAQGLIANGWLNEDPNCVDTLFRQLVDVTRLPAGYELAISAATPEMEQAGRATGVNAAWSYAKCYRNMLDAQPTNHVRAASTAVPDNRCAAPATAVFRSDTRQALQQALDQCAAAAPQRSNDAD